MVGILRLAMPSASRTTTSLRMTGLYARSHHPAAILLVLLEDEVVGHAGNVVADDAGQGLARGLLLIVGREGGAIRHPEGEEFADYALGGIFFGFESGAEIEIFVKKFFGLLAVRFHFGAEGGQALGVIAHVFERLNS